jgi:hypothetical protein
MWVGTQKEKRDEEEEESERAFARLLLENQELTSRITITNGMSLIKEWHRLRRMTKDSAARGAQGPPLKGSAPPVLGRATISGGGRGEAGEGGRSVSSSLVLPSSSFFGVTANALKEKGRKLTMAVPSLKRRATFGGRFLSGGIRRNGNGGTSCGLFDCLQHLEHSWTVF